MYRIELDNRKKFVKLLRIKGWHAMPVENKAHDGTPDVNAAKKLLVQQEKYKDTRYKYSLRQLAAIELWIELKIVEEWPKRAATAIKIRHFTTEQKSWLRSRIKFNPNCFIVIQIEEEHFLYKVSLDVLEHLGATWNKQQMYRHCNAVCTNLEGILDSIEKGLK